MHATRLTLVCHARTQAQKRGRFALDESLDMDWQAAVLSEVGRFKRAPRVLCGPELRAWQTALMFTEHPQVEPLLRECDFGRWQGQALDDIQQAEPAALNDWLCDSRAAPHGGESVGQLCERVGRWLHSLEPLPGHVVAVTHPFVIRAALLHALQCAPAMFGSIDIEPLSSVELRFNGRWRLRLEASIGRG
ncbi:histidine phosphatase family protein [Pseudomonas sp. MWU15-20650]|uniref:histidine phosphatase family protein n=1 Tax=Pseudomonas sp. MWU15-20650 TaxID=2933107 RepID=UPI00200BAB9C|nr:histidine phosphatase family protein [Pseudomonas sp. MWU15-20650]